MNPWEATGTVIGWLVLALVVIIAASVVLLIAFGFGVLLVSIGQTIVARLRGKPRPKLTLLRRPKEPKP